nr:unnamed protein product [Rangifer tarandus platyrhynchus]
MGCAKSKEARAAKRKAKGKSDPGGRMAAKDHLSSQILPKSSAVVVSGPPQGPPARPSRTPEPRHGPVSTATLWSSSAGPCADARLR